MMTKVLVYGYCVGVFSSRRLEKRLAEDIAFRVLAAGNEPDFRTILEFRRIHLKALEGLFVQVLQLAFKLGAMKLGRVAIDGTKIKANASKHKAMSYERMLREEQRLREEVKQLLAEAEQTDKDEDQR
jgi:transposase